MRNKALIINLIGGPGSGKSTTAAGLFYKLKKLGYNCEMSLEFAKDKVWEESFRTMDDQIYIFGKQYHKLWRLADKVDVIITDSPLLVSLYYNKEESKYFNDFVVEQFNKFNNKVFFLKRPETFQQDGRIQNKEESIEIDKEMQLLMEQYHIPYQKIACEEAVNRIVDIIRANK